MKSGNGTSLRLSFLPGKIKKIHSYKVVVTVKGVHAHSFMSNSS